MLCDMCPLGKIARQSPGSLLGRLWVWHTGFCPGWKRYVKTRWEQGQPPPALGSRRGFWNG
jgi:hypothetical protein